MKASKIIGIILIVFSIYLGYQGVNKISNNTAKVNLLGIKIDASNESGQTKGYLFVGLAVVLFGGGILALKKE
jgi:parallel beta-helix repeat protein